MDAPVKKFRTTVEFDGDVWKALQKRRGGEIASGIEVGISGMMNRLLREVLFPQSAPVVKKQRPKKARRGR